jgi:membrane protease subunit HflC
MRKIPIATLLTAGIVVLVLLVYALTFQVRFSELAVKVRLGQVAAIIKEPGLYPRWPWPIETIKKYDKRLRTLDTTEAEVKTRDGKNIIIGNYAVWRVDDPLQFFIRLGSTGKAEEALRARITQRRAAVIGNEDLSSFINLNEQLANADWDRIQDTLLNGKQAEPGGQARSLREGVSADFGISLEGVALRRISLPEETTQSVAQQMIAERQAEAARYREEGKAVAEKLKGEAEAARQQILAFAQRKAEEERTRGVQASTRILKQIAAEDTEFFEWLRQLDALRGALKQRSTIFLDNNSELFAPFARPLAPASQPAER